MKRFYLVILGTALGISNLFAQTQIVPPSLQSIAGTAPFLGPLANGARTYQLLIDSTQLTGMVGMQLNGLSFRSGASTGTTWPPSDATYTNYDIYLSGCVTPADRSFTFANNVQGTQVQVRSGSLFILANSYPSGGPTSFGPVITFNQGYTYSGGNLLLEIRHTGSNATSRSIDALGTSHALYGTMISACWVGNYTATSTTSQGNAIVVNFSFSNPLPVSLSNFTGKHNAGEVILDWETVMEQNSSHFVVERSFDGRNYNEVGYVSAYGNSNEIKKYRHQDRIEQLSPTSALYRLKMVDFDNSFKYSNVIRIAIAKHADELTVYPNPVSQNATVSFRSGIAGTVSAKLYNITGSLLRSQSYNVAVGSNNLEVDMADLPASIYYIRLEGVLNQSLKVEKR